MTLGKRLGDGARRSASRRLSSRTIWALLRIRSAISPSEASKKISLSGSQTPAGRNKHEKFSLPRGEIRRFALFLVVGVLAASTALLLRALLNRFVLFELAVAMAQLAGLMVAFALDRIIIFTKFSGSLAGALSRFFVVNLFSLTILTVVSAVFYRSVLPLLGWSFYPDYTAHFIGMGATALPSYFGHRFFSFRVRGGSQGLIAAPPSGENKTEPTVPHARGSTGCTGVGRSIAGGTYADKGSPRFRLLTDLDQMPGQIALLCG